MIGKVFAAVGLLTCAVFAVRVPIADDGYYAPIAHVPVAHAPISHAPLRKAPSRVHQYAQPQYEEVHYDHGPIIVKRVDKEKHQRDEQQNLDKLPGIPGHDFPIYHSVPHTSFSCHNVPAVPGMYANPETGCQAYHVCHDGREGDQGSSFLCSNGTLFNQALFACDWWYNVDCHQSQSLWRLNADPELNPYTPKKKLVDDHHDLI